MFYNEVDVEATLARIAELGDRLPTPVGYNILVVKPKIVQKTEGGIIKPTEFLRKEEAGSVLGYVVKLGPLAYQDTEKFPTGPWCKPGDFILTGPYRGSRFSIGEDEFTLMFDDMPLAVVVDPSGINRAY